VALVGADHDLQPWGWDNEFPRHKVVVPAFNVENLPTTVGEFLEFIQSGNYDNPKHWRKEDFEWKTKEGWKYPKTWSKKGKDYFVVTVFGEEVPTTACNNWPVFVSLAEALAFTKWRGARLLTEPEYHRAAYGTPEGEVRYYPWGYDPPASCNGNFGLKHWAPTPVGTHPKGQSAWGIQDLIGDGWEWTSTVFGPFEGFKPHDTYPGYSADFFEGKHYVMKGASFATDILQIRPTIRNWYQDKYPYVFAKFRLAYTPNEDIVKNAKTRSTAPKNSKSNS